MSRIKEWLMSNPNYVKDEDRNNCGSAKKIGFIVGKKVRKLNKK